MIKTTTVLFFVTVLILSCENKEVSHEDGPNFNEIHDDLAGHFDEVSLGDDQYYILERDRNNPHEGFGFMALKSDKIRNNQDSIKAMLKTMMDLQIQILAHQNNQNIAEVDSTTQLLYKYYLGNN